MSDPKRVPLEPLGDLVIARRNLDEATEIVDVLTIAEAGERLARRSLIRVSVDRDFLTARAHERSLALALAARLIRRVEFLDGLRTSSEPVGLHEQSTWGEDRLTEAGL